MKKNLKYIIGSIVCILLGAGIMYYLFSYGPLKGNETVYKTVTN